MIKQSRFLFLGLLLLVTQAIFAQIKTITGKVIDGQGNPMPGVSVLIKGTSKGVATDFDGLYSIEAKKGDVLTFSFIGFNTQKISVKSGDSKINVTLKEATQVLDDVVVTALGIKRAEKALSYNVQKVNSEELTKVKDANFVNSLNGKVAGVTIQRSAAGVGGATKVIMRGAKSISGNNNVLYVIDGMPIGNKSDAQGGSPYDAAGKGGGEGIADFNPEDIESISVLTGPSAAALYGAAAANGVILINTKKGKEGKLSVDFSSSFEYMTPYIVPKFQNVYANKKGEEVSWGDRLDTQNSFNPLDFFNIGDNFTNAVSASMGTKKNQTFISIASTNASGIMPNNGYYRYNITGRNTTDFLDDKMHADISVNYVAQGGQNMFAQGGYGNPLIPLYLFPRGDRFEDIKAYERYNPLRNISEQYWPYSNKIGPFTSENPYWIINREMYNSSKKRYMLYSSLKYDMADWVNISGRIRSDRTFSSSQNKLYASTTELLSPGSKGSFRRYVEEYSQTYADIMLNIDKKFGKYIKEGYEADLFRLTANIGSSYEDQLTEGIGIGGRLNLIPNLFSAPNLVVNQQGSGQSLRHTRNIAVFASAELGYKSIAYLTVTGRNDWASQLVNSSEPSIFYPSVGLSGVISEMITMPAFINFLKLRTSYTEVGSPISFTGITPGTVTYRIRGGSLTPISTYPFPDFKAERTRSLEFGLNSRFFQNKFNLDLTLYHSNTYNQTFLVPLPESSGYSGFYVQAGNVENKGIEAAFGYKDTYSNGVTYSTNITFTRNINKILNLVDSYRNPVTGEYFAMDKLTNDIRVGGAMGDITTKGILKRGEDGNLILNKDGSRFETDDSQLILLGNSEPDFSIGFRNDINWKNFNLSFMINGRFGGIVQSQTQAFMNAYGVSEESMLARDRGGVLVGGKLYDARKYYESIKDLIAYYTYDATNIRLQEASIGYYLDGKYLGNKVKSMTFSLIGRNLFMFYNRAPFDPELTANTKSFKYQSEFFSMPSLRSYGMSIKVKL